MKDKFYITTPIYYASGKPHIGHAFATLYADVIARYQKILGKEVFFVTGTDEHGSKVYEKAQEENKSPQQYVDDIAKDYPYSLIKGFEELKAQFERGRPYFFYEDNPGSKYLFDLPDKEHPLKLVPFPSF